MGGTASVDSESSLFEVVGDRFSHQCMPALRRIWGPEPAGARLFCGWWRARVVASCSFHSLNIVFVSPGFIDCLLDLYS